MCSVDSIITTTNTFNHNIWWILGGIILLTAFGVLWHVYMHLREQTRLRFKPKVNHRSDTCEKHTCGAIDPVSDPAYNMENVVKQSILLEEHLAEKNKYCKDCVAKHFLHIQGLLEEAEMLAGGDVEKYPLVQESLEFYVRCYQRWLKNREDRKVHLELVSELRAWRKRLMELYVLAQK